MAGWTEDRVKKLVELWNAGYSAKAISMEFGDVTRNAVIGKIHRLDVPKRTKPKKIAMTSSRKQRDRLTANGIKISRKRTPRVAKAKMELRRSEKIKPIKLQNDQFITLEFLTEKMCRWPYEFGLSGSYHYCGRNRLKGKSYCIEHFNVSVRKRSAITPSIQQIIDSHSKVPSMP